MNNRQNRKSKGRLLTTVALVLILALGVFMTGCSQDDSKEEGEGQGDKEQVGLTAPISIAGLKGPTGMGLVKLMQEPESYQVTIYQSPDEAVAKLLSGEADIAALPSNLGGVLYKKTMGDLRVIAVNTGGVLYLLENGDSLKTQTAEGLKELSGKTILASGKGGAPEYILTQILKNAGLDPEKDVTIKWLGTHADVAAAMMAEPGSVSMLPEPFVTVTAAKNQSAHVAFDLNELWEETYDQDLPMGIYVTTKKFAEEREADLNVFMEACDDSVSFVNESTEEAAALIAEAGIVDAAPIAQKAIPRCNILFEDGEDAKEMLDGFYSILFELNPASVGGALPGADLYYMQK